MPVRKIKLTREQVLYTDSRFDNVRLKVTASDGVNFDNKLFRYRMIDYDPTADTLIGQFDGICSPGDLLTIPEDEPTPGADPAWFRLDYIDNILKSPETMEEVWTELSKDIILLKRALDRYDEFSSDTSIGVSATYAGQILQPTPDTTVVSSAGSLGTSTGLVHTVDLVLPAVVEYGEGFRVKIVSSSAQNMSEKIFRYMREPRNPNDAAPPDKFNGVCDPADIEDLPEEGPFGYMDPKWFRRDYVDLVLATRQEAVDFRMDVVAEIKELTRAYDMLETFITIDVFWIS